MGEDIQQFEGFFVRNVWTPVDAIMELRDTNPSVDLVILSHFNSIPQFFAGCQGVRGKDKKKLGCSSGDEYLYVKGLTSLIDLDPIPGSPREIEKARFLYKNVRNGIAHSILAKKAIILVKPPVVNGQTLKSPFGWWYKADENIPIDKCDIEGFMIYVPLFYLELKNSINTYIENVKEGKCELKWRQN